jgi:hypothetical protein
MYKDNKINYDFLLSLGLLAYFLNLIFSIGTIKF